MSPEIPSTHQKALSINLDDKIYGTIAEIGAAQEVARWFFRVGAAAGSPGLTRLAGRRGDGVRCRGDGQWRASDPFRL